MKPPPAVRTALALATALALGAAAAHPAEVDPLAAEIARLAAFAQRSGNETPPVGAAQAALAAGRRLLALERMAVAREVLSGPEYVERLTPDERRDLAAFEAEWARLGKEVRRDRSGKDAAFPMVGPALLRALAAIAEARAGEHHRAALDYGRSAGVESGLLYLGTVRAERQFLDLARRLSAPSAARAPTLRTLAGEIEALESDLLKAYRQPASIDRHRDFILASGALKEARELDEAGWHEAALLRYLEAAMASRPLRAAAPLATDEAGLRDAARRLREAGVDHSIGELFLQKAQADAALRPAILDDVLPRYFAALGAAAPRKARPKAEVTVTLVRWPYT